VRRVLAATLAAGMLAWLALPWVAGRDGVRRRVVAALSEATGYEVSVDRLRVDRRLVVTLDGVRIAAASAAPFLTSREVRVHPGLATLRHGRLRRIALDEPILALDALPQTGATDRPTTLALPADVITVAGGRVLTGADDGVVLGPFGLTIDRAAAERGLEIGGRERCADGACDARWSARVGTDLARLDAKLHVRFGAAGPFPAAGRATVLVRGDPQGTLTATARLTETGAAADASLTASATLDVPARGGRIETHLPDDGITVGAWRLSGSGAASFRLDPDAVVLEPSATVGFRDAESQRVGERVHLDGTLRVPRGERSASLAVDLRAHRGEVLWDRFFLDLAQRPVTARGTIGREGDDLVLHELALSLGDAGTVTVGGHWNVGGGQSRLSATLDVVRLGTLFDVAVREPFGDTYPLLGAATVEGRLGGTLRVTGTDRLAVSGRLQLADVSGTTGDPAFSVEGLQADLPVSLGPAAPAPADPAGSIQVGALVLGDVRIADVRAGVRVAPNEVRAAHAVRLSLLGGHVDVTGFAARALDESARSARFGLVVEDVDLAAFTTALAWPPLRGGISAAIPSVTVATGAVRTEGELGARAFGGRVRVRNLHVDELWSPVPAIGLDLDFEEISLGAMTEALDVGQITGVVGGWIRNLSIVNGQPVTFDAEMESVPRSGVSQEISVRAIRQISIVAGPGGDALSSGILRFFDRYRYAKLGLRCTLENDRFMLRGIDEHDGKQVLVAGSLLPPRVNVYSQSQVIGFSEMMRRLRRAMETGAGEGGSE
jgi:hypothetical protein